MIYKIVRSMDHSTFSAAVAALAFGTFPLVWSQAILTEVNALNALFAALLLYFFIAGSSNPRMDWMGGIFMGLGLGNHLTLLFLLPLMFLFIVTFVGMFVLALMLPIISLIEKLS